MLEESNSNTLTAPSELEGRVCVACCIWKHKDEFFRDARRVGRAAEMRAVCRRCTRDKVAQQREKEPERFREYERHSNRKRSKATREKDRISQRNSNLKKKFGMTFNGLVLALATQNNSCAICAKPLVPTGDGRGRNNLACVDHDHHTGANRGILCNRCNTAIGLLEDDAGLITKAASYLKGYEK